MSNHERPGREVKLNGEIFNNPNIKFKIGAVENKYAPKTVYLNVSFWVNIKEREVDDLLFGKKISRQFSKELSNIYKNDLKEILENNKFFPFYNENIYTFDFPEDLSYTEKKCFASIELNLHTINCKNNTHSTNCKNKNISQDFSLINKEKTETLLYKEILKVAEKIANTDLLKGKKDFGISKSKK